MSRCDRTGERSAPPDTEAAHAASAARRLDDTFRSYLAERGPKPATLARVSGLVGGVVGLRLAGDAVVDLWNRDTGEAEGDRTAARHELLATTERVTRWYESFAASLIALDALPEPLLHDEPGDRRLIEAVRRDLTSGEGEAGATAVRMIWTADHLDAACRLQETLAGAAGSTVIPVARILPSALHRRHLLQGRSA
jgi:hypothetical protein